MDKTTPQHVAIIGAGVIGICSALALRRKGYNVTLIDAEGICESTSSGNAGAFAISEIAPLSTPGVLKQVPGWLLDPNGPLALRYRYLPSLAPWLWRFLKASHPRRFEEIVIGMSALLARVHDDLATMTTDSDAADMIRHHGSLTLYESQKARQDDQSKWDRRNAHGIAFSDCTPQQIAELEPALDADKWHAVYTPAWSYVDDPQTFTRALADQFLAEGGAFLTAKVNQIEYAATASTLHLDNGDTLQADKLVIASGVWSDTFATALGYQVPLESERGYHVNLPHAKQSLKRFILSAAGGFVILPMDKGIRIAGTVELASRDAPMNEKRAWSLIEKARSILPDLDTTDANIWMGHRPALPDTLPVISQAPRHPNIVFAFGHGHLGLTLGPTTGYLVSELIAGETSDIDLTPYRLDRF